MTMTTTTTTTTIAFLEALKSLLAIVPRRSENEHLFRLAVTPRTVEHHCSSTLSKHLARPDSNERLEFLGDAVLGLCVASYLYERYPDEDEGFLTRMRASIVNGDALAEMAKNMGIGSLLQRGEEKSSSSSAPPTKVMEDVLEALVAAVYLDAGYDACFRWVRAALETHVDFSALVTHAGGGAQGTFLRYYRQRFNAVPQFVETTTEQAYHQVTVLDHFQKVLAVGGGNTRKAAFDEASLNALASFGQKQIRGDGDGNAATLGHGRARPHHHHQQPQRRC